MPAMPTALTVDRCAEIRAELEAGRPRDEVLARAGLSDAEWAEAQLSWLEKMGEELLLGRFELSGRYTAAFLAQQSGAKRGAEAPAAAPASVPVAAPAPAKEARPTFLAAGAAAEPIVPGTLPARKASPLMAGTMAVDASAFKAALPFDPSTAPTPAEPPKPAVKRAPAVLSGTSMAFVAPKGPALPFAGGAPAAPPPPAPSMPAVKRPPAALAGTSMRIVAPKGPALPFAPGTGGEPAAAPPPAAPPLATPSLPAVKRPPAALSGTSMAVIAPKGPALPFQHGAQGGAPASAAPAQAPEPPAPGKLTLEQYASLCVELGVEGAKAEEVLKRYGLTADQGRAVDEHWKAKVAADPAARAAFDRAYEAYRAWLHASRSGGTLGG
jgi:hypothetical protein